MTVCCFHLDVHIPKASSDQYDSFQKASQCPSGEWVGWKTVPQSLHIEQDAAACRFDPQSGFYVSLVNPGYDRRYGDIRNVLVLAVSEDLEHWDIVKTLLYDDTGMCTCPMPLMLVPP